LSRFSWKKQDLRWPFREAFHQPVTVGRAYMLKLIHLVDEKFTLEQGALQPNYATTGPWEIEGWGQRLGEMEVWAVEGYGAAYTLQEILTTKSDDLQNRRSAWQWIVQDRAWKDRKELPVGRSGGFLILLRELQSLCFDVGLVGSRPPQDKLPLPHLQSRRGKNSKNAENLKRDIEFDFHGGEAQENRVDDYTLQERFLL
jgi:hypothetical protein